jgi:hypothetical protein
MSDVRIRAARGLISSFVRAASKDARRLRRQAGIEARKADEAAARSREIDREAKITEVEASRIGEALNGL